MHRDLHHQRIAERARDLGEERAREIGLVAVAQERVLMERVHLIEQRGVERRAGVRFERDAGFGDAPPLAFGLLALLCREGVEVGIEVGVAAIGPVELAVAAHEPARCLAGRAAGLIEKQRMDGRERALVSAIFSISFEQRRSRRASVEIAADQKPRPGSRREGNGDSELRVVPPPEPRVRLRPAEIEHELPVGVRLLEGGHRGGEAAVVAQRDVVRLPAGVRADAAGVLERGEKLMTQERDVRSAEGVPLAWIELVDALVTNVCA